MSSRLTYIDLFAGCGGLSLGLELAGYSRVFALEKSAQAAATYYHNLIEPITDWSTWYAEQSNLSVEQQLQRGLVIADINRVSRRIDKFDIEEVTLIAGGPPCQGFSRAGQRNGFDSRNLLAWRFLDIAQKMKPKAIVIENVEGIISDFKHSRSPLHKIVQKMDKLGYSVQPMLLNAKFYGVPQNRPRTFIVGIRKNLNGMLATSEKIIDLERSLIRQENLDNPFLPPPTNVTSDNWVNAEHALRGLGRRQFENDYLKTINCNKQLDNILKTDTSRDVLNHVPRKHKRLTAAKFGFMRVLNDTKINRLVLYWMATGKQELVERELSNRDYDELRELRLASSELLRKAGLSESADGRCSDKNYVLQCIELFATRKHSQRVIKPKAPSPTVMTIPDDHVHPFRDRVLTVREQARLQSFPDRFEFQGRITTGGKARKIDVPQYTQVGNAVPPLLAKALATHVSTLIGD